METKKKNVKKYSICLDIEIWSSTPLTQAT